MLAHQLETAIEAAPLAQLNVIAQTIWKALTASVVSEEDAGRLSEAVEARRSVLKALREPRQPAPRRVGSRPRSAASLERRRRWVAAGMMPPQIACEFTMGEAAALGVIAAEVKKRGDCRLTVGELAATAGVCATTVRNALRQARELGFLTIEERRLTWTRNLSNVVRLVSREWKTWLRLGPRGGCKTVQRTPTHIKQTKFSPFNKGSKELRRETQNFGAGGSTWMPGHIPGS